MKKKRVLITGVAGSIGSEIARQLKDKYIIYGVDNNETGLFNILNETGIVGRVGDIRDRTTMNDVFSDFRPHIVYHAGAYKHVTPMEWTPKEAIDVNVMGTLNVLDYSKIYPVEKFVFISTDKVVNATSIMGQTKKLGETMTTNSGKGYVAVRFGNVLGSRGSLMEIWQGQVDNNEPITVTSKEMERYFMTIPEAVELVIKASEIGKGGEILVLDMGEKVNIYELAKNVIKQMRNGEIDIIGTREGEQLSEDIMTVEERNRAIKKDNFYII